MGLREFQSRWAQKAGTALKKAVYPGDFAAIVNEVSPHGNTVVDHTKDLSAHPTEHNSRVEHYNRAISGQAPVVRKTPMTLTGVTAKAVIALPTDKTLTRPDRYIIKPYHETIHPKAGFWQHHPIQGWAEMSNQALWHAADMGHMHQKVHVSEHAMGPGHEKEPAIVIKMEPDVDFAYHLQLSLIHI